MKLTLDPNAVAKAIAKELAVEMKAEIEKCKLLTLQQAAELLGVSKPSVRAMLPRIIDLGVQSPRVLLSDVQDLIARRMRV